jgi:hypothetical protein
MSTVLLVMDIQEKMMSPRISDEKDLRPSGNN